MLAPLKINVGCADKMLPGYLNLDVNPPNAPVPDGSRFLAWDVRNGGMRALPLALARIEEIRADQFLEHLSLDDGMAWLRECRGIVGGGARLCLSVPDIRRHVDDYIDRVQRVPLRSDQRHPGPFRPEVNVMISVIYEWGHRMIYDEEMLRTVLELTGWGVERLSREDGANLSVVALPV